MADSDDKNYGAHSSGLTSPARRAAAIAGSNTVDLPGDQIPRALYCTGAGNVRVTMLGGGDPVVLPMIPGIPLPARVTRVWVTGTTATGIVGVW